MHLISSRSGSAELANNCRWNSCTWASPAGVLARACSAGDKAPWSVMTSVSSLRTTVTESGARPVRRFSWRTSQRHRPGLEYMVTTGRHHGFESPAEQELLLALDFAGNLEDVLSQPFRLAFTAAGGPGQHTPDFLAVTRGDVWLIDVRPGARIEQEDRVRFAAAAEVALSCGWRYAVAAGWLPNVQATLDTISAQRRPLTDPLGLQPVLLAAAEGGPVRFGELVEYGGVPAAARAQALHLIWERRLGIDLAVPLGDRSLVHARWCR